MVAVCPQPVQVSGMVPVLEQALGLGAPAQGTVVRPSLPEVSRGGTWALRPQRNPADLLAHQGMEGLPGSSAG